MGGALVVGLLFLAGAVYNMFTGDLANAAAGVAIAAVLAGVFFVARNHEKRAEEFAGWLARNADRIGGGGLEHEGALITPTTVLAQYQVALSFLIVTYRIPSRIYVVGHDATGVVGFLCTLFTLVLGWWGIPWGPVYTVQVTVGNLRGGTRQTVAERLGGLAKAPGAV